MKIGIYGGTFDPIHFGHLITAQFVLEHRKLDKILFIPCAVSPHKINIHSASSTDRMEMLNRAVRDNSDFEISDIEISRGGISYTFQTLRELKNKFEKLELIIGFDNLAVFDKWERPDEIVEMARLIVLNRKTDRETVKNRFFEQAIFINSPLFEVSSSNIRQRVSMGRSIKYFIHKGVREYILYKDIYINSDD